MSDKRVSKVAADEEEERNKKQGEHYIAKTRKLRLEAMVDSDWGFSWLTFSKLDS